MLARAEVQVAADTMPLAKLAYTIRAHTYVLRALSYLQRYKRSPMEGTEEEVKARQNELDWLQQMADIATSLITHPELTLEDLVDEGLLSPEESALLSGKTISADGEQGFSEEYEGVSFVQLRVRDWLKIRLPSAVASVDDEQAQLDNEKARRLDDEKARRLLDW
jgi:hypothetical protein